MSRAARLLAAALLTALTVAGTQAQAPAVPSLLTAAAPGDRVPAAMTSRLDTLQVRAVHANLTALLADAFDIEVTPGKSLRAQLDRRETHRNGAKTWAGHLVGEPLSSITVVEMNGVVQGAIRTLTSAYSIEPAPGGNFLVVRHVDADATGFDAEPLTANAPAPAFDSPPAAGDDGTTFDILVFYNEAARDAAGSDGAAQTRIALGVSETNTAYANSGLTPRLRLVGAELLSYTEAGDLSTDLGRLQSTGDGILDTVHTRRNQLGADLVMLVVGNTAGGKTVSAFGTIALSACVTA